MQRMKVAQSCWQLLKSNIKESAKRSYTYFAASRRYGNLPPKGSFGFIFDIDGVLIRGGNPIPAAKQILKNLVDESGNYKVPVVFVTNSGNIMTKTKADQLTKLLEVEIFPDQLVLSHTPLKMFTKFHKKRVLVSGQGPVEEVARSLGFEEIVTIDEVRKAYPVLDIVDLERRPKVRNPPSETLRPIEAVVLLGEPVRWETSLQLIVDLLLTSGEPGRSWCTEQSSQIPVLACNMDLLWVAEAKNPRFGHGTFMMCLETLYEKITGHELKYEALIGKPSVVTYNYAEIQLRQQAEKLGWSGPVKRVYAVGDNPTSDIFGANLYHQYLQASRQPEGTAPKVGSLSVAKVRELGGETDAPRSAAELPEACSSILVCTGVYSREQDEQLSKTKGAEQTFFCCHRDFCFSPELKKPTHVMEDVKDAVELVLKEEGMSL